MKLTSCIMQLLEIELSCEVKYMRDFAGLWNTLDEIELEAGDRYKLFINCYLDTVNEVKCQFIDKINDHVLFDHLFPNESGLILFFLNPYIENRSQDLKIRFQFNRDIKFRNEAVKAFYKAFVTRIKLRKYVSLQLDIHNIVQPILNEIKKCEAYTSQFTEICELQNKYKEKWKSALTIFENLALREIYMDQYAYNINSYDDLQHIIKTCKREPLKLDQEIIKWYSNEQQNLHGRLLYLLGEPGHGKSSFCIYLINAFPNYNIFVVNMNEPNYIKILKKDMFSEKGFENLFNRLFKPDFTCMDKTLVILDGYDELVSSYKSDDQDHITVFFEAFHNGLRNIIQQAIHIKIMVTSRRAYLSRKDVDLIFENDSDKNKILYLASLNEDIQKKWLSDVEIKSDFTIEKLLKIKENNVDLYELTKIPLLFQLIALFDFTDETKSKVELYEKLFLESVIRRDKPFHAEHKKQQELLKDHIYPEKLLHEKLEDMAFYILKNFNGDDTADIDTNHLHNEEVVNTNDIFEFAIRCFYCHSKENLNGIIIVSFMHRSFYQHFLAYSIYSALLLVSKNKVNKKACIRHFLRMMKYIPVDTEARNEIYELVREVYMYENKNKDHIYITDEIVNDIIKEIVNSHCIYGVVTKDECIKDNSFIFIEEAKAQQEPLKASNRVFVNSISLLSSIFDTEVNFDNAIIENMAYLVRLFICTGLVVMKCNRSILCGANLNKANLNRACFENANLKEIKLQGAYLIEADLRLAELSGSDLNGADLSRANLNDANLTKIKLYRSKLNGANLKNAILHNARMSEGDFSGADLSGASLTKSDLSRVNLHKAKLIDVDFSGSDLRWADLCGANITGVNLEGVKLHKANLRGAYIGEYKDGIYKKIDIKNLGYSYFAKFNLVYDKTTKGLPTAMYAKLKQKKQMV